MTAYQVVIPRTGQPIIETVLSQWEQDTVKKFGGLSTIATGQYGYWIDDTGRTIADVCNRYEIAVTEDREEELMEYFRKTRILFQQECLYVVKMGKAYLLYPEKGVK